MAKYLVETYYTCTFKVNHYLDNINETELKNLEKRDDGKFEVLEVKLDNRKTKSLDPKNNKVVESKNVEILGKSENINTISKENVNISPNLRLDLSYTKLTDYTETGTNALNYHEQNVETAGIYGGFIFNKEVFKDDYIIRPTAGFELGLDLSPSSDVSLNYVSDPNTKYTKSIDQQGEKNVKGKVGFDLLTETGWSFMFFFERNQSDNSHSNTIYLMGGYISAREDEYAMVLEDNKASVAVSYTHLTLPTNREV